MHNLKEAKRLIVALDVDNLAEVEELICKLTDVEIFKVGPQILFAAGFDVIELLKKHAKKIFLDIKFHDIPSIAHRLSKHLVNLGIWGVSVHSMGGLEMLDAMVSGIKLHSQQLNKPAPLVFAVTILTSITPEMLKEDLGVSLPLTDQVIRLALKARRIGADGVIASCDELQQLRKALQDDEFIIITPGVRFALTDTEHRSVGTPFWAIAHGATYIVMGRDIISHSQPNERATMAINQISQAILSSKIL